MTPRPRADRDTKRTELAATAAHVFAERGVANTAVSDIVKAAGVAQGTFYLYFESKEDLVVAVVERMADSIAAATEATVAIPGAAAVDKLFALSDALSGFEDDAAAVQMADFIHRPENRALHDRLTEHLAARLAVVVEGIVAQGVSEGSFAVDDVQAAAWFVMCGLQSVELRGLPAAEMTAALRNVMPYALRALGCREVRQGHGGGRADGRADGRTGAGS